MENPFDSTHLEFFLNTSDRSEMEQLAKQLQTQYAFDRLVAPHSDTVLTEMLSPLEVAAQLGKSQHVLVLLHELRSPSNVRQIKKIVAHAHNKIETLACLRAIESGQAETAAIFLHNPQVIEDLAEIKIRPITPGLNPQDYLSQVQKAKNYPISYNGVPAKGNVALVLAARLNDARLFNSLLKRPALAEQLSESAVVAFLAATRNNDGTDKAEINRKIVFQLLSIPAVHQYATSRWYDFQQLLDEYNHYQQEIMPSSSFQATKENSEELSTTTESYPPTETDISSSIESQGSSDSTMETDTGIDLSEPPRPGR